MKGQYLLAYVYTLNNQTGVGSINMTMEEDQPITPEVIQNAIRVIRENSGWDESVPVVALSWCRYEAVPKERTCCSEEYCRNCTAFRATKSDMTGLWSCSCVKLRKGMISTDVYSIKSEFMRDGSDLDVEQEG